MFDRGDPPGATDVTYDLTVELVVPLPGFVKRRAEQIMHTLWELKARVEQSVPRVLLFTGKGGVGKTTTAAATALRCADAGPRTIVLSTDPAHSLADAFDVPLGPLPSAIAPKLVGQQLDAQERMEEAWGDIQHLPVGVFEWAGVDAIEAEELSVLPGLDEVFALADITSTPTRGSGTSSSSTARRRPRRSGCCRCPTSCPGTWSACSR